MPVFTNAIEQTMRLDFRIMQNGWTSLYWRPHILDADLQWFKNEGFGIIVWDCTEWSKTAIIKRDIYSRLEFPHYGDHDDLSFDAINDHFLDLEFNNVGLILVFKHFQHVDKKIAHTLLDILADKSRYHLLFGNKLITLVQVDDPNYQIEDVGACSVIWNHDEWLNSSRRP